MCKFAEKSSCTFLHEAYTHTHTHTRTKHTHSYNHTFTCSTLFARRNKVGEVQWRANPLSNFDSSHRRFPPPSVAVRVTRQARNVVIAEIMAMPTARCGEQNDGDYVTLKFNSTIVLRTRGAEFVGTLILFRKTARRLRRTLPARSRPETAVEIPRA